MLFKRKSPLLVFLIPAFVFMAVFLFYPFLMNIYASFFDMKTLSTNPAGWNDFASYRQLFGDPAMGTATLNTLKLMALVIVFQVGIALLLACFVDSIK